MIHAEDRSICVYDVGTNVYMVQDLVKSLGISFRAMRDRALDRMDRIFPDTLQLFTLIFKSQDDLNIFKLSGYIDNDGPKRYQFDARSRRTVRAYTLKNIEPYYVR